MLYFEPACGACIALCMYCLFNVPPKEVATVSPVGLFKKKNGFLRKHKTLCKKHASGFITRQKEAL